MSYVPHKAEIHICTQDRERNLRTQITKLEPEIVRLQQEAIIEAPVNIDFLEESKAVGLS